MVLRTPAPAPRFPVAVARPGAFFEIPWQDATREKILYWRWRGFGHFARVSFLFWQMFRRKENIPWQTVAAPIGSFYYGPRSARVSACVTEKRWPCSVFECIESFPRPGTPLFQQFLRQPAPASELRILWAFEFASGRNTHPRGRAVCYQIYACSVRIGAAFLRRLTQRSWWAHRNSWEGNRPHTDIHEV